MEASLWPYAQGAVVCYTAPFNQDVCHRYGVLPTHPVLILDAVTTAPKRCYQCMVITSKIDRYPGYRLFMNVVNPKYRKYGVIRCNQIFTIEASRLGHLIGYIPPQLIKKCINAYAFEIGLTDVVPEYYKGDTYEEWLNAGEANIPDRPDAFTMKDMPDDARKDITVATAYAPRVTADPTTLASVRITQPLTINDAQEYHPINSKPQQPRVSMTSEHIAELANAPTLTPVDKRIPSDPITVCRDFEDDPGAEDPIDTAEESEDPVIEEVAERVAHAVETMFDDDGDTEEPELIKKSDELQELRSTEDMMEDARQRDSSNTDERLRHIIANQDPIIDRSDSKHMLTADEKQRLETRSYPVTKKTPTYEKSLKLLTDEDRYEIWMGRLTPAELAERKIVSKKSALGFVKYVLYEIYSLKEYLVNAICAHDIHLQFLSDKFMVPYRVMTPDDVHDVKMGLAAYESYALSFGISMNDTYIGELRNSHLL